MVKLALGMAAAAAVLALVGCGPPPKSEALVDSYKTYGCCNYVAIVDHDKLESPSELRDIGHYVCHPVDTNGCFVHVYLKGSSVPPPGATLEQAEPFWPPVFTYSRNYHTNLDKALWNCAVFTGYGPDECLAT